MIVMSLLEYALLAFTSLFVVIEPIAAAPVFLAMTPRDTLQSRARMARLACVVVAIILLTFAIAGTRLLDTLGIGLPAFQTAGGVLLFLIALDMLRAKDSDQKITSEESEAGAEKADIAVTPLAIPLLAGPGAISTSILLANRAGDWFQRGSLYLSIILIAVLTYWILKLSAAGANWLNPIFLRVTTRLMGLILAALAMQFVFNGLKAAGLFQ